MPNITYSGQAIRRPAHANQRPFVHSLPHMLNDAPNLQRLLAWVCLTVKQNTTHTTACGRVCREEELRAA